MPSSSCPDNVVDASFPNAASATSRAYSAAARRPRGAGRSGVQVPSRARRLAAPARLPRATSPRGGARRCRRPRRRREHLFGTFPVAGLDEHRRRFDSKTDPWLRRAGLPRRCLPAGACGVAHAARHDQHVAEQEVRVRQLPGRPAPSILRQASRMRSTASSARPRAGPGHGRDSARAPGARPRSSRRRSPPRELEQLAKPC